jgi:hypothetical protein
MMENHGNQSGKDKVTETTATKLLSDKSKLVITLSAPITSFLRWDMTIYSLTKRTQTGIVD